MTTVPQLAVQVNGRRCAASPQTAYSPSRLGGREGVVQQTIETKEQTAPRISLAPRIKRRTGRTRYGELQREANRRRKAANRMMVGSALLVVGLLLFFYKLLT